jgi:4-amino-4-deoxy-L-arabinose transferase-like glycosyltransferase
MIDLALAFLYLTARKWFGLKNATMILVLCLLFSPFITYVPIYYTDTISMPMSIGMLYFYTLSLGGRNKNRLLFLFLAALLGALGVLIKPTVGILFAALVIHLFLTERFTSFMKQAVLVVAVLFIGLKIYAAMIDSSGILPLPYKQTGYPYTHWMMMGLKGPYGFYDYHDVKYTESFLTKEKRKEANMEVIKIRLHNYGLMGIARLFSTKNLFTWGDGTYFAPVKLDRGAKYTAMHSYLLPMKSNQNYVYIYFCQIVNLSLLSLILLSGWRQLRNRQITLISVCALSLFGLGVFLLVWEARSRYLINFAPMILLCSLDGLLYVKRP